MEFFNKAKELSGRFADKSIEFSSDEIIADTIIKAVIKQEKVNAILKSRGSNYRVSSIDLSMGIPPSVSFGIRRVSEIADETETVNVPE